MMPRSDALKVHSWNIQGANHPIKKKKILNVLKKERADIALLQETHLNSLQFPFVIETVHSDPNGCYVFIQGYLYGENIVILNVYAPSNFLLPCLLNWPLRIHLQISLLVETATVSDCVVLCLFLI